MWLAICLVTSIVVINIEVNLEGLDANRSGHTPGCLVPHPVFYLRRTGIDRQLGLGVAPRISLGRMWFYLPLLALICFPLVTGLREEMTWLGVITIITFLGVLQSAKICCPVSIKDLPSLPHDRGDRFRCSFTCL